MRFVMYIRTLGGALLRGAEHTQKFAAVTNASGPPFAAVSRRTYPWTFALECVGGCMQSGWVGGDLRCMVRRHLQLAYIDVCRCCSSWMMGETFVQWRSVQRPEKKSLATAPSHNSSQNRSRNSQASSSMFPGKGESWKQSRIWATIGRRVWKHDRTKSVVTRVREKGALGYLPVTETRRRRRLTTMVRRVCLDPDAGFKIVGGAILTRGSAAWGGFGCGVGKGRDTDGGEEGGGLGETLIRWEPKHRHRVCAGRLLMQAMLSISWLQVYKFVASPLILVFSSHHRLSIYSTHFTI